MNVLHGSTVCLAVLLLAGCSNPQPPKKTVFDPLTQQEERARDVQKTVDQNAAETRRAVDSQERGDADDRGEAEDPGNTQDRGDSRH